MTKQAIKDVVDSWDKCHDKCKWYCVKMKTNCAKCKFYLNSQCVVQIMVRCVDAISV